MHVFRATGLAASAAKGDEDERIEVQAFALADLEAMIDRGEIREGKTLVALLLECADRHRLTIGRSADRSANPHYLLTGWSFEDGDGGAHSCVEGRLRRPMRKEMP